MLIALFTIMILGGSSTAALAYIADTRDSVKTVMVKDDRQKEALSTLKAMKKRTNARNKHVVRASKNIYKALRQDDINIADIDAIWTEYFAEIDQYNHDMLDLRWELKEHINREEWEEIFTGD
jgi:tRNA U34 5-carboxymethylaminomethyl modifying enzyme MnmG/GidA